MNSDWLDLKMLTHNSVALDFLEIFIPVGRTTVLSTKAMQKGTLVSLSHYFSASTFQTANIPFTQSIRIDSKIKTTHCENRQDHFRYENQHL